VNAIVSLAAPALSDAAYAGFQKLLRQHAGIHLADGKKAMVAGRLARRLKHHALGSFEDYQRLIAQQSEELQCAIDLLTTNETHFFREQPHFDLLKTWLPANLPAGRNLRVWSAAASSGQEAYSVAMLLSDVAPDAAWDVFGSDISRRVLQQAERGQYDIKLASEIPPAYLRACCLKGVGEQAGSFVVDPELRRRVRFRQIKLNAPLPDIGLFDVILLRNVLIYFQPDTKHEVIQRVLERLRPGGLFLVGHSESLGAMGAGLQCIAPSVYRKP